MKKIVFLSLLALCLPWGLMAQGVVDDLYYVPSKKDKVEQKNDTRETVVVTDADQVVVKSRSPQAVRATAGTTTVVVRDTEGRPMDVDAYNRRYDSSDYDFTAQGDTLYVDRREDDGLDGQWVDGFDGSADDYEYATRIIRFRNPRYAIPVSSPLYFDVVYGLNTWDWNVYYDGLYAYVFPTFTNRLWWDWRFNSVGWWGYPYYGWGWGWHGWYDPWYYGGWAWHHPYWHHPWHPGPGWGAPYPGGTYAHRTSRRVVGTRTDVSRRNTSAGTRGGIGVGSSRRTGSYTRPTGTSTLNRTGSARRTGTTYRTGATTRAYNRGSSTTPRNRSYNSTPQRSGSSRSSFSTGGGSFRSSGGMRSGGGSRSGGGGGGSRRR